MAAQCEITRRFGKHKQTRLRTYGYKRSIHALLQFVVARGRSVCLLARESLCGDEGAFTLASTISYCWLTEPQAYIHCAASLLAVLMLLNETNDMFYFRKEYNT